MAAARPGRTAAGDPFERGDGLRQMIFFERWLLRHSVLPHVIGDLMAALDDCAQRLRVEFADSSRRKDRCLDAVCIEQLDEPPARRIQLGRNTLRVSADPIAKPAADTRAESRGSRPPKADAGERRTVCWRETDSNPRSL